MRALAFFLLAACGVARDHGQSDWERLHMKPELSEERVDPPAPPRTQTLLEFGLISRGDFRFFIDGATLNPGKDGVVRYVLVARSPAGAENITYEGMRCATGEVRRYAIGRPDGTWGGKPGAWLPVQAQLWHRELARNFFCRHRQPIDDRDEGVRALREGGLDR